MGRDLLSAPRLAFIDAHATVQIFFFFTTQLTKSDHVKIFSLHQHPIASKRKTTMTGYYASPDAAAFAAEQDLVRIRDRWKPAFAGVCARFDAPMHDLCAELGQLVMRFQREKTAVFAEAAVAVGEERAHQALDGILDDSLPPSLRQLSVLLVIDSNPVAESVKGDSDVATLPFSLFRPSPVSSMLDSGAGGNTVFSQDKGGSPELGHGLSSSMTAAPAVSSSAASRETSTKSMSSLFSPPCLYSEPTVKAEKSPKIMLVSPVS